MALDLARIEADRTADRGEAQEPARAPAGRARTGSGWNRGLFSGRRASLDELVLLTRQLSLLLQSGNGLVPSMAALAQQTGSPTMHAVLGDVHERLQEGRTLSSCLEAHPRFFDPLFVNIVRAGEASGELRESLIRLSSILETRRRLRARVREAMTYPLILTVIMAGVVVFMLLYLVPRFGTLFQEMGDALPWSTRLILGSVDLARSRWWALIPMIGVAVVGGRALARREAVRRVWDWLKVSLPVVGRLTTEAYLFQLFSAFGLLLGSRVPHLAAIDIVRATVRHSRYQSFFAELQRHVEAGRGVAQAFREADFLPETVKLMVFTGEMSGALDTVMVHLSEHYREELESDIRRVSTLVEPVMLVVMGLMVGFIATAFILPLFRLSRLVH